MVARTSESSSSDDLNPDCSMTGHSEVKPRTAGRAKSRLLGTRGSKSEIIRKPECTCIENASIPHFVLAISVACVGETRGLTE